MSGFDEKGILPDSAEPLTAHQELGHIRTMLILVDKHHANDSRRAMYLGRAREAVERLERSVPVAGTIADDWNPYDATRFCNDLSLALMNRAHALEPEDRARHARHIEEAFAALARSMPVAGTELPMVGLMGLLTDEQRERALSYDGPESFGPDELRRSMPGDKP